MISCLQVVFLALFFCVTILTTESRSQWSMGSRNIAMGQAYTALSDDRWAVFHNPALIDPQRGTLGLFTIRNYGLRELEDHAAVLAFPVPLSLAGNNVPLGIAAGIHSYGFELFRETQIRSGWSIRFKGFRLGIAAKYVHLHIQNYGSKGSLLFDAGMTAALTDNIQAGYRMTNLFHRDNHTEEQPIHPSEMVFGISWNAGSGFILSADVVKDILYPVSFRSGMEIEWLEGAFLRGGWTTRPFTWSTGVGFQVSRIQAGIAVQNHEILGLSPGMDWSISF